MKKLFLSLLPLLLFTKVNTQNNFPPVYEITTDTVSSVSLPDSHWQMLEDKTGKFGFNQVTTLPVSNQFHYNTTKTLKLDYSIHGYWFRYILKNEMNHDAKICLGDTSNLAEQSDFYFLYPEGKVTHSVNGNLVAWSKLDGLKQNKLIPIEIKSGEDIIIYRRIYNTYRFFVSPKNKSWVGFIFTERITQQINNNAETRYFNAIHDSFIFGVLVFASLFIFFFFIIVREKVYLYFSLFLFFLGLGRVNIEGEMYHFFFRESPVFYAVFVSCLWFFFIYLFIYFIRYLLNVKYYLPRWDKFLMVFSNIYAASYFLMVAFQLIIGRHDGFLSYLPDMLVNIEHHLLALCLPGTFLLLFKHIKTNKLLIIIVLPLLSIWSIAWVMRTIPNDFLFLFDVPLYHLAWLEKKWFLLETILLSCLVLTFSWILLHRFGDLKKQIIQKELEKEIERSQLIEQQKVELVKQVDERTAELKQSLDDLKSTQSQLIQSEKMASLGELTAGIAHEIQNPLNFVNNFSEVNTELLNEMKDEIDKGNLDEAKAIAKDIIDNQEKINHHGKRADAIVKGMLQHSRSSSGVKEPTDINALADEYLRLAYHGLRAKDKSFNATMKTDFDESIGNINIIPQDIGRVILNLITNAFYVVDEKKKSGIEDYDPTVSVSTKKVDDKILISVKDNGNGIPQKVLDKIFQPFFTTKPTGQGTGLGLSLSYDIIKAHKGELKVETKEGEFAEFIIRLPLKE